MKKQLHLLVLLVAVFCSTGLANSQTRVKPPTPFYHTGFEDWTKNDLKEEIITIDGYRWKVCNAVITSDSTKRIPTGHKALELRAGSYNGEVASLELLDNIEASQIAFAFSSSGMDGVVSRQRQAWAYELTYDNGENWHRANSPFIFDRHAYTATIEQPEEEFKPFRFRICYTGNALQYGTDYRILIDDIRFYSYQIKNDQAWEIRADGITNGYETSQTSLTVSPALGGATWVLWGSGEHPYPKSTSYITVKLDDKPEMLVKHLNPDIPGSKVTFDNLTEGKHSLSLRVVDLISGLPYKGIDDYKMDFYVRPYKAIETLSELRNGEIGAFYELTPKEGSPILINFSVPLCNQYWLWDGEMGMLVNDPLYYLPISNNFPEKFSMIKKMRGQLIKQDNNLVFVVDGAPTTVLSQNSYQFFNKTFISIAELNKQLPELDEAPVSLQQVRIVKPQLGYGVFPPTTNQRFEVEDKDGARVPMRNIYSFFFLKNEIDPSQELDVFAIVGKDFFSGEAILFPILAREHNKTANEEISYNKDLLSWQPKGNGIALHANEACMVAIYSIRGEVIAHLTLMAESQQEVALPSGNYVIVATSPEQDSYYTTKVSL